jgi:hypothetical protein
MELYCASSIQLGLTFIPPLNVIKTAQCETVYMTLFIAVIETDRSLFYSRFEFSRLTYSKHSKREFLEDACSVYFNSLSVSSLVRQTQVFKELTQIAFLGI